MRRAFIFLLFVAFSHVPVYAAEPSLSDFAPGSLKLTKGRINEVMVLGSPHLSQLPKSFDVSRLSVDLQRNLTHFTA